MHATPKLPPYKIAAFELGQFPSCCLSNVIPSPLFPPSQLDNVGSIVVIDFMLACFQIALQMEDRGRDTFWYKLLYGQRAHEAMTATLVRSCSCLVAFYFF